MLIRSQNKQNIFNMNAISGIGFYEYYNTPYPYQIHALIGKREYFLGEYSTKEKVIKVLNMIEARCNEPIYYNDEGGGEYVRYDHSSFHMPDDSEVE